MHSYIQYVLEHVSNGGRTPIHLKMSLITKASPHLLVRDEVLMQITCVCCPLTCWHNKRATDVRCLSVCALFVLSFLFIFFFLKLHSMYYYVLLPLLQILLLLLLLFLFSGAHYYPLVDSFSHFFYPACTLWECCIISKKLYKPPLFPICSTEKKKGQWKCRIKQINEKRWAHWFCLGDLRSKTQTHTCTCRNVQNWLLLIL